MLSEAFKRYAKKKQKQRKKNKIFTIVKNVQQGNNRMTKFYTKFDQLFLGIFFAETGSVSVSHLQRGA